MNPVNQNYPSLLRRFGAMLYDTLLVIALCLAYGALALWAKVALFGYHLAEGEKASLGWLGFAGMMILIALYFCFFWGRSGQTLGMKTWRLMVVGKDGRRLTYAAAAKRWLLAVGSFALAGIGFWWSLIDKDSQTLHDLLSDSRTVLVDKEK